MSGRLCFDCGAAEDVRAYPVADYPAAWGPYLLCGNCRAVLDDLERRALADKERRLLADWGRLGDRQEALA